MDTRYIEPTQTTKILQLFPQHLNSTNEFIPPDAVAKYVKLKFCFCFVFFFPPMAFTLLRSHGWLLQAKLQVQVLSFQR